MFPALCEEFVWATCPVTTVSFLVEGSGSVEVYFVPWPAKMSSDSVNQVWSD